MKLDQDKLTDLLMDSLMLIGALIISLTMDNFSKSRKELTRLYETEFSKDTIIKIKEEPYEGGKGNYNLFKVSSDVSYFPILLDPHLKFDGYKYFVINAVISKKENSTDLTIENQLSQVIVKMRNPKNENHRLFLALFCTAPFVIGLIIILAIPNSKYEERRKRLKIKKPITRSIK